MATESIAWPQPPTSTDANDGPTASYVMGCEFTVTEATECPGLRWRVPDSVSTPPAPASGHYAVLWNLDGGGRLAIQAFTPVPGGDQDVLFGAPVALSPGVTYAAAVLTVHYTYRSGGGFPFATPGGVAVASNGKLTSTSDPDDAPLGTTSLIFYVSPLIGSGDDPAEGSVALGLGLAVAASGARPSQAAVALGAGLAVTAGGQARAEGVAALSLGLSVAGAGARGSAGAGDLGLGLATNVAGGRTSAGGATSGLRYTVAATGSNGESGRPVKPWPFPVVSPSSYPWTPRPVKSFEEVAS